MMKDSIRLCIWWCNGDDGYVQTENEQIRPDLTVSLRRRGQGEGEGEGGRSDEASSR
jgi:hypothetical protein